MSKKDFTRHNAIFTEVGGLAVRLINDTGADSIKGTLVRASVSTDNAVDICPLSSDECLGIVYSEDVPDTKSILVVTTGIAEVLLEDGTASTRGNWVRTSTAQVGRADATNADPPGGGIPELDRHMTEIGHCVESNTSGTNVLCKVALHFN